MEKEGFRAAWTSMRIVIAILLVLSFVLFFLSWINISLNVLGQKLTIPKLFGYLSDSVGYSSGAQFKNEVYSSFCDLSEQLADEGIHMDPQQAARVFDLIYDRLCSSFSQ